MNAETFAKKATSLLAAHDVASRCPELYNRLAERPEPGITLVQPITSRVLVAPRLGAFVKGETLTLHLHSEKHSVTYLGKDGPHRSLVLHNNVRMTYFNHYISR